MDSRAIKEVKQVILSAGYLHVMGERMGSMRKGNMQSHQYKVDFRPVVPKISEILSSCWSDI